MKALSDLLAAILAIFRRAPAPEIPVPASYAPIQDTAHVVRAPAVAAVPVVPVPVAPPVRAAKPEVDAARAPSWLDLCRPLAEHFEGCRLTAYQDVGGVWTVGYGCTGPGIAEGTVWTAEHAESQLVLRLNGVADDVDRLVKVEITAAQKAALVDFAYNLGVGALGTSTLLRLLNASDFVGAANQFGEWVLAAGKPQPGLIARRAAEKQLFTTGAWQP